MRRIWKVIFGVLLILIGCGFFLYPNYREWQTQKEVDSIIDSFEESIQENKTTDKTDPVVENRSPPTETPETVESEQSTTQPSSETDVVPEKESETILTEETGLAADYSQFPELYQAMQEYNQNLITNGQHIVDAWSYEQTPVNLPDINNNNPVIGYIEIPDMDIRLPLLLGASESNLQKGAAILSETSMPIGGENTNCVISAHRGWQGSAYFQYIEDLGSGSKVYITTPWETLVYEYRDKQIIDPEDVNTILIQEGKDMITLFTCHPYQIGGGPYRMLVFCDRVDSQKTNIADTEVKNPQTTEASVSEVPDTEGASERVSENVSRVSETASTNRVKETERLVAREIVDDPQTEGIDMLAIEQTLRFILPLAVILFAVLVVLVRVIRASKRRRKKRRISSVKQNKEKAGNTLLDNKNKKKKKEKGNSRRE